MRSECSIEEIFKGVDHESMHAENARDMVTSLEFSSGDVRPGSLFFCIVGTNVDGHGFAQDAADRGAAGLVVEKWLDIDIAQYKVADTRSSLAVCSSNFYGNPSSKMKVVGITGTNGKTTTGFLVEHIVSCNGMDAGLIGTVECHIGNKTVPSERTTPESRDFQRMLAEMVDAGVDVCACEVSSHALSLDRVKGTEFHTAAFTNLTQDHLDYHETMESYFDAKARLFTEYKPKNCVICTDSDAGKKMAALCEADGPDLIKTGWGDSCDVRAIDVVYRPHSTTIDMEARGEWLHVELPLVGRFNVENALVSFGIGIALGLTNEQVVSALESAPQVPGRLERVIGSEGCVPGFGVLVDYAHTPDSIEKAISAVRAITDGKVICVFGCGGDRDHGKRPKMGKAALKADMAVVTSDNPRTEDPHAIIEQILAGMDDEDRYVVIEDRKDAIRHAISEASEGDVVLIAGKGHEDYQIIGSEKHHFDDREAAACAIEEFWGQAWR